MKILATYEDRLVSANIQVKFDDGSVLIACPFHLARLAYGYRRSGGSEKECGQCERIRKSSEPLARTDLDYESGLTWIICNHCEDKYYAGTKANHKEGCPVLSIRGPSRKYTDVPKVVTYMVPCPIDEDGNVVYI